MGVRVAYGKKSKITSAIASGVIPKDSLIITSDAEESELFFYDAAGNMKRISERKQFATISEAQAWVDAYGCDGNIISVHNGSDGEIIIVDTASGSVRRKIGDGTKTYSQLPFDDEDIYNALAGKCDASVFINTTLAAGSWSNGQQTLTVAGLGAEQNGVIGISQSISDEQFAAAAEACLYVCSQSAGSITIAANGTVPECDIPVTVILLS